MSKEISIIQRISRNRIVGILSLILFAVRLMIHINHFKSKKNGCKVLLKATIYRCQKDMQLHVPFMFSIQVRVEKFKKMKIIEYDDQRLAIILGNLMLIPEKDINFAFFFVKAVITSVQPNFSCF